MRANKNSFLISKENKSINGFGYLLHKKLLNASKALSIVLGAENTAVK